jgi:BirA family transcriptional regulator, biotin operon repressor / biotin---[acetyl-CoA-carboxylase] ligase
VTPYRLIEFAELDSTNRYACAQLAELAHGDVIQAAVQTAGRGRMARRWISHLPGNLCLSLVLKPAGAAPAALPLANLSQLLALSVCRALEARGVTATLKWPNDILVGGRKIAGILAETVQRGGEFQGLVLGLGVNLNLDPTVLAQIDQPATALNLEVGHPVDVPAFRDALLADFFAGYEPLLAQGFGAIHAEFVARCPFLGQTVQVRSGNELVRGTARAITPDGALELSGRDGPTRTITIGEMFVSPGD